MPRPRVAVAIPAYNEGEGIEEFLVEIDEALAPLCELTLVVIDDGSTDGTPAVLEAVAAQVTCRVQVQRTSNAGHGPALMEAYRLALAEGPTYVLAVDGDGQFAGSDLRRLLVLLDDGGEGVCGVRRFRHDPWFRMVMTRLLRTYVRVSFGVEARDANCPLRGYRAEVLGELHAAIPPRSRIPNLLLSILAARRGAALVEVDVSHRVRRGTTASGTMFAGGSTVRTLSRLVSFSVAALAESRRFRRTLAAVDASEKSVSGS